MNNESNLYTGLTSASFAKKKVETDERKKSLSKQRKELLPLSELLLGEIQKSYELLNNNNAVDLKQSAADIKAEMLANRKSIAFLKSFESQIANILRDNKG